ncbi:MAG: YDG domain-containing protein, partial [Coriobacteriales bacterium]|nr:YDG domain-containing protein [Coriobacteriales bacterium]
YTYKDISASISSGSNAFEITVFPASSVDTSGKTSVSVRPKTGLLGGTYGGTLHIDYTETVSFNLWGHETSGDTAKSANISLSFTVNKRNQSALTISGALPTSYGSSAEITVGGGDGSGAVSLRSSNSAVAQVSGSAPKYTVKILSGTGSYTLTANKDGDGTFNAATAVSRSATATKIDQPNAVTMTGVPPTSYRASAEIVVSGGNGTGSLTLRSSNDSVVSVKAVTGQPGHWTVTVLVANSSYQLTYGRDGDNNYNARTAATVSFPTVKTTPQLSVNPSTAAVTYGTKLADMPLTGKAVDPNSSQELAGTFIWEEPDTRPVVGNSGYRVYFQPLDVGYNRVEGIVVTPVVGQATPQLKTAPKPGDITYGQTLAASTLAAGSGQAVNPVDNSLLVSGNFSWDDDTVVLSVKGTDSNGGDGRQAVLFSTGDPNYQDSTLIVWLRPKVAKANVKVQSWPSTSGDFTYGVQLSSIALDNGQLVSALAGSQGTPPSGEFYWKTANTYPTVANSGSGSSGYTVAIRLDEATKANYNEIAETHLVSVPKLNPRQLVGSWQAQDKVYDGQTKATVSFIPASSGDGSLVPGDTTGSVLGACTANFAVSAGGRYIPDATAGEDKPVAITDLKLLGAVPNYSLPADLAAYLDDPDNAAPALATASISKADGGQSRALLVKVAANRPAQDYPRDLNDYIPNAAGSPGVVSYQVSSPSDPDDIIGTPAMNAAIVRPGLDDGFVASSGILKVPANEVAWDSPHADATFVVTIRSDNYTDVVIDVTVHVYPLIDAQLWIASAPDKVYDGIAYRLAVADSTIQVPEGYDGPADISTGKVPAGSIEYWYQGFGNPLEGGTNYGPTTTPPTDAGEYKVWAVATGDYTGTSSEDYFRISARAIIVTAPSLAVELGGVLPALNSGQYLVTYTGIAAADKDTELFARQAVAAYDSQADSTVEGYYTIGFTENDGCQAELKPEWQLNYELQHMDGVLTVGSPSGGDDSSKIPVRFSASQIGGEAGVITSKAIHMEFSLDASAEADASLELLQLPAGSVRFSGTGVVYGGGLHETDGAASGGSWESLVTGEFGDGEIAMVNIQLPADSPYRILDSNVEVKLYRDDKPPAVQVAYKSRPFMDFLNSVSFGLFFQNTAQVIISATDEGSDVEIEYNLQTGAPSSSEPANGWLQYTGPFSVNGNAKFTLWARVTDAEGNKAVSKDGIVIYTDVSTHGASATTQRFSDADVMTTAIRMNGNTAVRLVNLSDGGAEVLPASAWSAVYGHEDGDHILLKGVWLRTLPQGNYTLQVEYSPAGVAYQADMRTGSDLNEAPSTTTISLHVTALDQDQLQLIGLPDERSYTYGVDTGFKVAAVGGSGTGSVLYEIIAESEPGQVASIDAATGEVKLLKPGTFEIRATKAADSDYLAASCESGVITFNRATPAVAVTANANRPSTSGAGSNSEESQTAVERGQLYLTATVSGVAGNTPRGSVDFLRYPVDGQDDQTELIQAGLQLDDDGYVCFELSIAVSGLDFSQEYIYVADYTPTPASSGFNNPTFADQGTDAWYLSTSGESAAYQINRRDQAPLEFIGALLNDQDAAATAIELVYGGGLLDSGKTAMLHVEGGSIDGEVTWHLVQAPANVTLSADGALTLAAPGNVIVSATMAGDAQYNPVSGTFSVQIGKAKPLSAGVSGTPVVYGQRLVQSTPTGTIAGVDGAALAGEWYWRQPTVMPDIDDAAPSVPLTYEAVFLPTLSNYYQSATFELPVAVQPAKPIVNREPQASSIQPGQTLADSKIIDQGQVTFLMGSTFVTVPGGWSWDALADQTAPYNTEGSFSAPAVFTPADPYRFESASGSASFTVSRNQLVVASAPSVNYLRGAGLDPAAPNPGEISYGKYLISWLALEDGKVYLSDDVGQSDVPGSWSFTDDQRRADEVGLMAGVPVVFTPDDASIPAAYAVVDVQVGKAALRLVHLAPARDIVYGQTLDEMEAQTNFLASDGWQFSGAFGETVLGELQWQNGSARPTDDGALYFSNDATFYPHAGSQQADNWAERYVVMTFGLELHVKPSRWAELLAAQSELEYWLHYIRLGDNPAVSHEENYTAYSLQYADAALSVSQRLTASPDTATERMTNAVLYTLEKSLQSLVHDHPLLSLSLSKGSSGIVTATGTQVKVTIKGCFYDVDDVSFDGLDVYAGAGTATGDTELMLAGRKIGQISEGGTVVTFDAAYVDTLSEGWHTLEVYFKDEHSRGTGQASFKVDWPDPSGGGGGGGTPNNPGNVDVEAPQAGSGSDDGNTVKETVWTSTDDGSLIANVVAAHNDQGFWLNLLHWLISLWWLFLLLLLASILIWWLLVLWKRRKKDDDEERRHRRLQA